MKEINKFTRSVVKVTINSKRKMTFAGKVILITGAASGIGKATAINFARLGAELALTDRNKDGLQNTGTECEAVSKKKPLLMTAELTNEQDVQKIVYETIHNYSSLDILINNAGVAYAGSIENTSLEEFDRIFKTNVRAGFHLTSLAVPYLKKSKGTIVNTSSLVGVRSIPGSLAYNMSKSAVDQMTRCVALELAGSGIRVNSLNPGIVLTDIEKNNNIPLGDLEVLRKRYAEVCPLGRNGEPDEMAKVIEFLCSEDASFITGINLLADGGRHATCLKNL